MPHVNKITKGVSDPVSGFGARGNQSPTSPQYEGHPVISNLANGRPWHASTSHQTRSNKAANRMGGHYRAATLALGSACGVASQKASSLSQSPVGVGNPASSATQGIGTSKGCSESEPGTAHHPVQPMHNSPPEIQHGVMHVCQPTGLVLGGEEAQLYKWHQRDFPSTHHPHS